MREVQEVMPLALACLTSDVMMALLGQEVGLEEPATNWGTVLELPGLWEQGSQLGGLGSATLPCIHLGGLWGS